MLFRLREGRGSVIIHGALPSVRSSPPLSATLFLNPGLSWSNDSSLETYEPCIARGLQKHDNLFKKKRLYNETSIVRIQYVSYGYNW